MKHLLTVLSILSIASFTACSSNGISSVEEETTTTEITSCNDILRQKAGSYYGTMEEIQQSLCIEFDQILRRNNLTKDSPAALECRRMINYYRNCYQ